MKLGLLTAPFPDTDLMAVADKVDRELIGGRCALTARPPLKL